MAFAVGKRVLAESESTNRRPRSGVVKEVFRGDPSPRYRIGWDDGHESNLHAVKRRAASRATPQDATGRHPHENVSPPEMSCTGHGSRPAARDARSY